MTETRIKVLFLCTGNSCRSQMAESLLREIGGELFEMASAGTHPAGVNPLAIWVMIELGIDISGQRSKSVDQMFGREFDYVITVCDRARESCPVLPGAARKLHWSFPDPAEATGSDEDRLEVFRDVRDQIADQIRQFVSELSNDRQQTTSTAR